MMLIHDYVNDLTNEEIHSIIDDYMKYEITCRIDEGPLRRHTMAALKEFFGREETSNVILWAERLASQCYRTMYDRSNPAS